MAANIRRRLSSALSSNERMSTRARPCTWSPVSSRPVAIARSCTRRNAVFPPPPAAERPLTTPLQKVPASSQGRGGGSRSSSPTSHGLSWGTPARFPCPLVIGDRPICGCVGLGVPAELKESVTGLSSECWHRGTACLLPSRARSFYGPRQEPTVVADHATAPDQRHRAALDARLLP